VCGKINTANIYFVTLQRCSVDSDKTASVLTSRKERGCNRSLPSLIFFFTGSTAPLGPGLCFQFHDQFTGGRAPWTSDQLVARPLPK
jgi:hypothetical protein